MMSAFGSSVALPHLCACREGDPPTDAPGNVHPVVCSETAALHEPAPRLAIDPVLLRGEGDINHYVGGEFDEGRPGEPGTMRGDECRAWLGENGYFCATRAAMR
jgi:hypothetical protein